MKSRLLISLVLSILVVYMIFFLPVRGTAGGIRVGTWKTAQTIQPFFYERVIEPEEKITIFPFTNPADQKVALLAGSLDMCGMTLAHAICPCHTLRLKGAACCAGGGPLQQMLCPGGQKGWRHKGGRGPQRQEDRLCPGHHA